MEHAKTRKFCSKTGCQVLHYGLAPKFLNQESPGDLQTLDILLFVLVRMLLRHTGDKVFPFCNIRVPKQHMLVTIVIKLIPNIN
jgi:hypothetical protein